MLLKDPGFCKKRTIFNVMKFKPGFEREKKIVSKLMYLNESIDVCRYYATKVTINISRVYATTEA